jgi:hypothetical protein
MIFDRLADDRDTIFRLDLKDQGLPRTPLVVFGSKGPPLVGWTTSYCTLRNSARRLGLVG